MPDGIPTSITRADVESAIVDFDANVSHGFAPSTSYDLEFNGKRYPPKAIVGLAARRLAGRTLTPEDFKGGEGSKCFRILRKLGFDVVPKRQRKTSPFEVGDQYFRQDIYEIIGVPVEKRRGNWETPNAFRHFETVCGVTPHQ